MHAADQQAIGTPKMGNNNNQGMRILSPKYECNQFHYNVMNTAQEPRACNVSRREISSLYASSSANAGTSGGAVVQRGLTLF